MSTASRLDIASALANVEGASEAALTGALADLLSNVDSIDEIESVSAYGDDGILVEGRGFAYRYDGAGHRVAPR